MPVVWTIRDDLVSYVDDAIAHATRKWVQDVILRVVVLRILRFYHMI